jgi:putative transposase
VVNISTLCRGVKMSRQGYYQERRQRRRARIAEEVVLTEVKSVRKKHPRMGVRKVLEKIKFKLNDQGVMMGRDRLYGILRPKGLLIRRGRRRIKTTDSRHGFRIYEDLHKSMLLTGPHQMLVSDLTYLDTDEGPLYMALITDAWSRKIVGYEVSDNLEAIGCLKALEKACGQLPKGATPIHHSDRGSQYCCGAYIGRLKQQGIIISMTQDGNCYDNAMAERINGILKTEYLLGERFRTKVQARMACRQAIALYNTDRPHMALKYKTPEQVHKAA